MEELENLIDFKDPKDVKKTKDAKDLSFQESLLNDSRISPTGNGSIESKPNCTTPTSSHKTWAAVLLGFIFFIISSPAAYNVTSQVSTYISGQPLMKGSGPTLPGLIIHTLIFIIIVRIILW